MTWATIVAHVNLHKAWANTSWKGVESVLGLQALTIQGSEQCSIDGGLWDVAYPLLGIPPPPSRKVSPRSPIGGGINSGQDDGVAQLADPRHVAATLQSLSDSAAMRKER